MKRVTLLLVLAAVAVLSFRSVRLEADQQGARSVRLQADRQAGAIKPTPRARDGKPDLSGVYQASNRRGKEWDAQTPGDAPGQPAQLPQPNAGTNVAEREAIPYKPETLARAQEILNRRSVDDPAARCLPLASPRVTAVSLFPIEFVQTPTKLVILYEYLWLHRSIPIGGKHPDDADPSFMGDSVARWDGDTLVVDVTSFKPGGWLGNGFVHSDALHLVERYTRVDHDQMKYEVTIEDPKVLTRPFKQWNNLMLREGARLREYSCAENNLDPQLYDKLLADPSTFIRKPTN